MGEPTIWMATVFGTAILLLLTTVEEALRRRAGGLRFQHELRRGAHPAPRLQPLPVRAPAPRHRPRSAA